MTSKSKFVLTMIFALFLIVSVTYAINHIDIKTKVANTEFRYLGPSTDYSDLTEESNWEIHEENPNEEDCAPTGQLPCVVAPNMSSIASPSDLVDHLNNLSENAAKTFVETKSISKRD